MRFFILLCLVVVAACKKNSPAKHDWHSYKAHHGKSYESTAHEDYHRGVFERNKEIIEEHNKQFAHGKVTYTKELNRFADIDPATFAKQRNGFKKPAGKQNKTMKIFHGLNKRQTLPASFDWRDKNAVSPIKDQGQCGSCWAFSTTGALESALFLKTNQMPDLSEQNIVDCVVNIDGCCNGCGGGFYTAAWDYVSQNGGIDTESSYPYTSGDSKEAGSCNYQGSNSGGQDTGFVNVAEGDENALQQALVANGPVSVAIDAQDWQLASDGIYNCQNPQTDHAVLLVGYNTDPDGTPYWIVKNSWGTDWGDQGYFKMLRGSNACNIANNAAYPTV